MTTVPTTTAIGTIRAVALEAVVVAGIVSVALALYVGSRNPSHVLIAMFFAWVLAPFAAMLWAARRSAQWSEGGRKLLYTFLIIIALASVAIYGRVALGPAIAKPAAPFLIVPGASWVVLGIVSAMASRTAAN